MKKSLLVIAAAAALGLSVPAFAGNGNNGGGNGGCGVGQSTNGCSGTTDPSNPGNSANGIGVGVGIGTGVGIGRGGNATGGSATANGGQGGAGGNGGAGGQGGVGIGGSVAGSGNSNVRNTNANSNANRNDNRLSNQQGQVATGGSARSNSGGNTLQGTQANGQSVTVTGDTVTYQAQDRAPVSTAYAPMIAPTAACMGSTSGGAQGVGFGLSFGGSWTSANCETMEQVRVTAQSLGDTTTAAEMMCAAIPAYKAARERAVHPCASDAPKSQATAASAVAPKHESAIDAGLRAKYRYYGSDPVVLARLGIAPLGK